MKINLLRTLLFALPVVLVFSCADEEEAPNPLIGTWTLDIITWDNISPDSLTYFGGSFEPSLAGITKKEIVFNEDQSVEYEQRVQGVVNSFEAEWEFDEDDNEITIELTNGDEVQIEFNVDDMELRWITFNGPASLPLTDRTVEFNNLREVETYVKEVQ